MGVALKSPVGIPDLRTPNADSVRAALSASARGANAVIETTREAVSARVDGFQQWLKVIAAATDPAFTRWACDMRQAIADGSIQTEIEQQPDPVDFVEQWKRRSGTT